MAEAVAIACVAEEVLAEQYWPLNEKEKVNTETTILTNTKLAQNENVQANKNGDNNKRKVNGNWRKNGNNDNKLFCQNCKSRHNRECLKNSNKCF